jgi:hypothetical protein
MEATLLLLILIVLAEGLFPGGVKGLVLGALVQLAVLAAVAAVVAAIVGAIAFIASQSTHPWSAAVLIVMGALYAWIGAEWAWKQLAPWARRRRGAWQGTAARVYAALRRFRDRFVSPVVTVLLFGVIIVGVAVDLYVLWFTP